MYKVGFWGLAPGLGLVLTKGWFPVPFPILFQNVEPLVGVPKNHPKNQNQNRSKTKTELHWVLP